MTDSLAIALSVLLDIFRYLALESFAAAFAIGMAPALLAVAVIIKFLGRQRPVVLDP